MVVYYDLIFLLNFIYQFGVFAITNRILHIGISNLRIVFGAAAGCIIYILTVMMFGGDSVYVFLLSVVSDGLISVFLYRIRDIKQFVKVFLTQIAACICLAGILDFLNRLPGQGYLLLTGMCAVVFLVLLADTAKNMMSERILSKNVIVQVLLKCGERDCQSAGLIDSGNALFDPVSKRPVCIMTQKLYHRMFPGTDILSQNGYRVIPYRSVGKKNGVMEAFVVDIVEVIRKDEGSGRKDAMEIYRHILFAVCPDDFTKGAGYEIILHPKVLS